MNKEEENKNENKRKLFRFNNIRMIDLSTLKLRKQNQATYY